MPPRVLPRSENARGFFHLAARDFTDDVGCDAFESTLVAAPLTGRPMRFLVTGTDTAGSITVRRDTAAAALKKAAELNQDGSWDITITGPDGRRYTALEFDQMAESPYS